MRLLLFSLTLLYTLTAMNAEQKFKERKLPFHLGDNLRFQCPYGDDSNAQRFFCKGENRSSCHRVVNTTKHRALATSGRFSMVDDLVRRHITLNIFGLRGEDAGTYWCGGANDSDSPVFYNKLQLTVEKPKISVNPPGDVVEGNPVTLNCSSDAKAKVYTWYRGNSYIYTGAQWVKEAVSLSADSGNYTCQVTTTHYGSQMSEPYSLNVQLEQSSRLRVMGLVGLVVVLLVMILLLFLYRKGPRDGRHGTAVYHAGRLAEGTDDTEERTHPQHPQRPRRESNAGPSSCEATVLPTTPPCPQTVTS